MVTLLAPKFAYEANSELGAQRETTDNRDYAPSGGQKIDPAVAGNRLGRDGLSLSEEQFRRIFEDAPVGIVVISADERVLHANQAFSDMLGYQVEELVGSSIFDTTYADDLNNSKRERRDTLVPGERVRWEKKLVRKDGKIIDVAIHTSTITDDSGELIQTISQVMDVSVRVKAVTDLGESEKRFRDFAEADADRFWETDKHHRYTFMSPPSGAMRRPSEQMIGELPWGVSSRQHSAKDDQSIQLAFESLEAFRHVQNVGTTPDGEKRHLYLSAIPYYDAAGAFAGFRGTTTDETREVEARERISRQEGQLVDAIEHLNDAITIYDADQKLVAANRKAREHYTGVEHLMTPGNSLQEVVDGYRAFVVMPGTEYSDRLSAASIMNSLQAGNHSDTVQYRDGRWMRSNRYRTAEGGLLIYRTDITQQKIAEDELIRSANRFRDFGTIASDWFWEMDADLRFSFFSDRFVEISGVRKEELLGKSRQESGLDFSDPAIQQNILDLEAHRFFKDFEHSRTRSDGTVVYMSTSGVPVFDADGQFQGYHGTGRDISRRKHAENAILESEQRFKDFGTIASDWFWELDENLVFSYFSEKYESITGIRIKDIVGKRRDEVRPPALSDEYWQSYIDRLENHLPFDDFTHTRITPSGDTVWIATSGIPIFDEVGAFTGYRCIARDITEQKTTEILLRENESRLQDFGNSVADYYWELDENYYVSYLSDSYRTVTGIDPEESLSKKRDEYRPPDLSDDVWSGFVDALHAHQPFREFVNKRTLPGGKVIWMSDSGIPYFDTQGRFKGYRGVGRDITAQKELEQELGEAQEKVTGLLARTGEGYWDIDLQGVTRDVNPAMCKILDRRRDEIIGKSVFEFVDEQNLKIFHHQIALRKQGVTGPYEIALLRPDGSLIPCVNNATPMYDQNGAPVGSVGLWTDISDIKQALTALENAKATAEAANEAKSRFLASASHDLRQPLQSATLYIDVLHELVDDPKQLEIIKKSLGSLGATTDILNALLDVSKLDAGLVIPKPVTVPIGDIFTRVRDIEPIARNKGLAFKVVESSAVLHTDPALIETVLRNLLNNAVKYTEAGRVLLGVRRVGDQLRMEVWDTGPGIPEGQLESVFEEFYQLSNPHRDRDQGLGLGLSIVKRLAELLGGELDIRSTVGRGTVFSITLPSA